MSQMFAIDEKKHPELKISTNIEKPKPGPGHVLIRNRAAGINHLDFLQKLGKYPPLSGESKILGVEVAGEIAECGEGCKSFKVGDRVCALIAGGGYGEYCTALETHVLPLPKSVSFVDGAAIPEAFLTAFQALELVSGGIHTCCDETILIHAGGSQVGLAAVHIARVLGVPHIITTSSEGKREICKKFGATLALDRSKDWVSAIEEYQKKNKLKVGCQIILDLVGASYFHKNIKVIAREGRWVIVGLLSGSKVDGPFEMRDLLRKRCDLRFTTLRTRPNKYKTKLIQKFIKFSQNMSLFDSRVLDVIVHKQFLLKEAEQAHKYLKNEKYCGKLVLIIPSKLE